MGFLSGLANISPIGQLTNLFGSNSFNNSAKWGLKPGDNVGGNFGHSLNLWSGQTDSANLQYTHNMSLQKDAQNFAKWQMNNAHQTEVKDLQKAGLNPVLSNGGNGADAGGVSAISTGAGGATGDPLGAIMGVIGALNNTKQTQAMVDKTEAEVKNLDQQTKNLGQTYDLTPDIVKANIKLQEAQGAEAYANSKKHLQETIESRARAIAQEIANTAAGMDLSKRQKFFDQELEVARLQLKAEATKMGLQGSVIYQGIDSAFETVGKVFHGGVNYNYGSNHNYSHNSSNVKVEHNNRNYNPVVGF